MQKGASAGGGGGGGGANVQMFVLGFHCMSAQVLRTFQTKTKTELNDTRSTSNLYIKTV